MLEIFKNYEYLNELQSPGPLSSEAIHNSNTNT